MLYADSGGVESLPIPLPLPTSLSPDEYGVLHQIWRFSDPGRDCGLASSDAG